MAAKKAVVKSDRTDPRKNKSLAIRLVIKKTPGAKTSEIIEGVKKEYGHTITANTIYMVKAKKNMKATSKKKNTVSAAGSPSGAAQWVEAIKIAHQLLKVTGSVDNATALLKAVSG